MSGNSNIPHYLPEFLHGFEDFLRSLTSGEASFYVYLLGLVVPATIWLIRRKKNSPSKNHSANPQTATTKANDISGTAITVVGEGTVIHIDKDKTEPEKKTPLEAETAPNFIIDKLPDVPGKFFGRETELKMLDDLLSSSKTRVIQFIAAGGTGKTKLLRHWLNENDEKIPNRIIWSFYSQGTTEAKQVSLSPLLAAAFDAFAVDIEQYKTDEAKANAFVDLLIKHQCFLVLDGLEPMQHGLAEMEGQLKDKYLLNILRRLLNQNAARCVITSRIKVYELHQQYGDKVITHDLHNLALNDAVHLLQSLGVKGREKQLADAANEYARHALAIRLLGKVLAMRYHGDVQQRDRIAALPQSEHGKKDNRHAFRVMQEYQDWFAGKPELSVLFLMGLFDQPIETAVLLELLKAQIADLTQNLDEERFYEALNDLREHYQILSQHPEKPELLDCHPLIREYFGRQLQQHQPQAWQQAHAKLYDFYKNLPAKHQPDTLDEMRPLFAAVAHGCAAGLHQQALLEVYWPRIQRSGENYLCSKLSAFSDDLAAVAHFFDTPWQTPAAGLGPAEKAGVLNWAGFRLRALGRLREALEPMRASIEMVAAQKNWIDAAKGAGNLSELQLTLGDVADAVHSGKRAVDYADQSEDLFQRMNQRAKRADALHQAGQATEALTMFAEAEQLQQEDQPEYPRLYSVPGFRYCDLLLAQAEGDARRLGEVMARAEQTLEWATRNRVSLLDEALDQLTLARAHLQQQNRPQATHWLEQAVAELRKTELQYLPLGLLTRATLHRQNQDYALAQQDLQEVYDIASQGEMRLHLTDYHLESARLALAMAQREKAKAHVEQAAKLIEATGYHRRDGELRELKQQL